MIILALDGLEPELVKKFHCQNLLQNYWGKTNLADFKLLRTVVLWASFLTGRNMDQKFPDKEAQWNFRIPPNETFLNFFKNYKVIDLPAFNYNQIKHEKERKLLKGYFEEKITLKVYDNFFWQEHEKIKKEHFQSLKSNFDLLISYFNLADGIGHLNLGTERKMKKVYDELDQVVAKTKRVKPKEKVLIISDHGMKTIGRYGDHAPHGFFSFSEKINLANPKITEFYPFLKSFVLPDF